MKCIDLAVIIVNRSITYCGRYLEWTFYSNVIKVKTRGHHIHNFHGVDASCTEEEEYSGEHDKLTKAWSVVYSCKKRVDSTLKVPYITSASRRWRALLCCLGVEGKDFLLTWKTFVFWAWKVGNGINNSLGLLVQVSSPPFVDFFAAEGQWSWRQYSWWSS